MHSSSRLRTLVAVFLLGTLLPTGNASAAVKLTMPGSDDIFVNVGLLLQPWYQLTGPLGAGSTSNEFFIRRARPMLFGQITKWVSFFFETDNANWGKGPNGWGSSDFFVQDAVISFDLHPAFHLMAGMILPPFVHTSLQGATSLHTLEYHTALIRFPAGATKVWRDVGVGVRGVVAGGHLEYRASMTQGVPDGYVYQAADAAKGTPALSYSTKSIPRFTGRVSYNFFDNEDSLFYGGLYHGKKKILSIGLAGDVQPRAFGKSGQGNLNNYFAVGGDVFVDLPIGKNELAGQLSVAYYGGDENKTGGLALAFDLGYVIGRWEPLVSLDWYRKTNAADFDTGHLLGAHVGLNYWWKGHNVNIKLDLGVVKDVGVKFGDAVFQATLQPQLLF